MGDVTIVTNSYSMNSLVDAQIALEDANLGGGQVAYLLMLALVALRNGGKLSVNMEDLADLVGSDLTVTMNHDTCEAAVTLCPMVDEVKH